MFGIGMPELIVIFVIALLVFGPKELPGIAKTIGRAMSELRRASDDLKDGIQREIDLAEQEATAEKSSEAPPPAAPIPDTAAQTATPEESPQPPSDLSAAEAPPPNTAEAPPAGIAGDPAGPPPAGERSVESAAGESARDPKPPERPNV